MSGYIDSIKIGSIRNLFYMINSISNLRNHISNASYYIDNLNSIKERISDSTTLVVKPTDFEMIDDGTRVFFSKDLTKKIFRRHEVLSNKLESLWNIFQELYDKDPDLVVYCVTNLIGKTIPKKLTLDEKDDFMNNRLSKFLQSCNNVNALTDSIFKQAGKDLLEGKFDIMSICGILLSFCANSQTHLYFVEENIKKAIALLGKNCKIQDIFSIEASVMQNTETVTDIRAIRNAVSHASFGIKEHGENNEYVIDFQGGLSGFAFDRKYTGKQLLEIYSAYDNLRNFQELLIRIALLKATLKIFFVMAQ